MNTDLTIPFHQSSFIGDEYECFRKVINSGNWIKESEECNLVFKNHFANSHCFLTNSCSSALEMAIRALGIGSGDEVIIPGFGYVAVANAVVNNNATPVFADVKFTDGNIDTDSVATCISPRTKAIIAIHYAGNAFDIGKLTNLCKEHNLYLIEDAAQGIGATFENKPLGSFGHIACLSFDYMKNVSCGQGGLLIVNDESFLQKVQTVYDNGTNKTALLEGKQNQFDWVSKGNNCLINPIASYFLLLQLRNLKQITDIRLKSWNLYYKLLLPLEKTGKVVLPHPLATHNGHIFYLITDSESQRTCLRNFLRERKIYSEQHYSFLASSSFGHQFSNPRISLQNAERFCSNLLRLPMWNQITEEEIATVSSSIHEFYSR